MSFGFVRVCFILLGFGSSVVVVVVVVVVVAASASTHF